MCDKFPPYQNYLSSDDFISANSDAQRSLGLTTLKVGAALYSRDVSAGYLACPPYLRLFAEGHEEAERRVPGVCRT